MEQTYFGNPLGTWIIALAIAVVGAAALFLLKKLLCWWLPPAPNRATTVLDDKLLALAHATKAFFVFGFPLTMGLSLLSLGPTPDLIVKHLRIAISILQIGFWLSAALTKWANDVAAARLSTDQGGGVTSISVLRVALIVVLWILVVLILLDNLGVDVMTLIAGLGVGGIAIALAVQGILADLVASVVIVLDKPFVIGDQISVGKMSGTVESIGLKTTRVRSSTGEEIVFSHSDLIGSRIRNFRTQRHRKVEFTVGVPYTIEPSVLAELPALIAHIIEANGEDQVTFERSHVAAYGDATINIETVYLVLSPDHQRFMDIHQRVLLAVHGAFAERQLELGPATKTLQVVDPVDEMDKGDEKTEKGAGQGPLLGAND